MNFVNLYDFAHIWYRHSLIHFLSEYAKTIGGHHVGFQDGVNQSPLDYTRIFAQFFAFFSSFLKAMNLSARSNIWANIIIVPEVILKDQKALFSTC